MFSPHLRSPSSDPGRNRCEEILISETHAKPSFDPQRCSELLDKVRRDRPRVHCVTNTVAMNITANMLLAVGAIPSMSINPEEIGDFVRIADALLVNLGTLNTERETTIPKAIDSARTHNKPWILDPVLVNRSTFRLAFARRLLQQQPAVVRANAEEVNALFGDDSTSQKLATDTVIAQTGQADTVTDTNNRRHIYNGHELMSRVTGLGCATSALLAAFAAITENTFDAAVSTLLVIGITGEIAAESARGPGSLQTGILDALYDLNDKQIAQRSKTK